MQPENVKTRSPMRWGHRDGEDQQKRDRPIVTVCVCVCVCGADGREHGCMRRYGQ